MDLMDGLPLKSTTFSVKSAWHLMFGFKYSPWKGTAILLVLLLTDFSTVSIFIANDGNSSSVGTFQENECRFKNEIQKYQDSNFLLSCKIDEQLQPSYISKTKQKSLVFSIKIPSDVLQVQIRNKRIPTLFSDEFQHLKFCQVMDLSHNDIEVLSENVFRGLIELKCLDLSHNQISDIDYNIFSGLISLEALYLSYNRIPVTIFCQSSCFIKGVDENTRSIFKSLKILKLDSNCIKGIFKNVFHGMGSLEHLDLSLNYIGLIAMHTFRGLSNLRSLNLENTGIANYDFAPFLHGPKQLEFLNLGYNFFQPKEGNFKCLVFPSCKKVKNVHRRLFRRLITLRHLILTGNKLTAIAGNTFDDLKKLTLLDLSQTSLTALKGRVFWGLNSLESLNLSRNHISDIEGGYFLFTKQLTELDLSYNDIIWINGSAFKGLHQLESLYLNGNDLTEIQQGTFAHAELTNLLVEFSVKPNFGWDVFVNNDQQHVNKLQPSRWRIKLMFSLENYESESETDSCWMTQAVDDGWLEVDTNCGLSLNSLANQEKCQLMNDCPREGINYQLGQF